MLLEGAVVPPELAVDHPQQVVGVGEICPPVQVIRTPINQIGVRGQAHGEGLDRPFEIPARLPHRPNVAEGVRQLHPVIQIGPVPLNEPLGRLQIGLKLGFRRSQFTRLPGGVPQVEVALGETVKPFNVPGITGAEFLRKPQRLSEGGDGLTCVALG